MLKNILISLFLGLIYVGIPISYTPTSGISLLQCLLIILLPLPVLLAIFSFRFWIAMLCFVPSLVLIFTNLSDYFLINVLFTIPLLIIFCYKSINQINAGKYVPILLILYSIVILLCIDAYFNKNNLSLINSILDNVHLWVIQLNSINPNIMKNYNSTFLINFISFMLPASIAFCFYIILIINYIIAVYVAKINNVNTANLKIGYNLPKYYIYLFISFLIVTLITYYKVKNNWHILYIMYNIATITFIPFLVAGFGVINYLIEKHKGFIFLFIVLLLSLSFYVIIILCFLGFLKEAKLITIAKKN